MCEITVGAIQERLRQGVSDVQEAASQIASREHWIDWGGKLYGPYRDARQALQDGFHLPTGEED
jgi:hypothetical protein